MEKLTNEFKIEFTKGDTYALALKFKNLTEDLRLAYFSVKENPDDSPLIQKSLGAGISKIDDRAYKNEKTYKIQLQSADTINLDAKVQYLYDIQVTVGNVVKTVLHGLFVLGNTITGTSSVTMQNLEVAINDELEIEPEIISATKGIEYEQDPVACAKIGDLTKLDTENKESIVNAINEVNKNTDTNIEDINKIKNGTIELPSAKNVSGTINGKNISEIFEDDGTTVKKAKVCEYASLDISKGTIEERLTNLGFKQGNIMINDSVNTVAENVIFRQGNYVKCLLEWGDFDFDELPIYYEKPTKFFPIYTAETMGQVYTINFGKITNNEFIPNSTIELPVIIKIKGDYTTGIFCGYSYIKAKLKLYGMDNIENAGKIEILNDFNEELGFYALLVGVKVMFGYEVSPIE